ncbi:MAG: FAD:protein FMN transferase [Candidatus Moranbacteria bacterium]|nr:FAD:protein FMN transferase [Candidatus Moranbacteria bacterium]
MANDVANVSFDGLGTEIGLRIVVGNPDEFERAKKDLEQARGMYEKFSKVFSRFEAESNLTAVNNALGAFHDVPVEFVEIASHCLEYYQKTDGVFDPRIISTLEAVGYKGDFKKGNFKLANSEKHDKQLVALDQYLKIENNKVCFLRRMDFSGIAKGFITDKVAEFLKSKGWKNFLLDSGGDMFLSGVDQAGDAWRINVEGIPYEKMMFALSGNGLATSGISKRKWEINGQKFHHLINPKKPESFLFDLKTVTVISKNTEDADVWAKTLFLMGKESAIMYARENDLAAIVLGYDGRAWISPKAKEFLYI